MFQCSFVISVGSQVLGPRRLSGGSDPSFLSPRRPATPNHAPPRSLKGSGSLWSSPGGCRGQSRKTPEGYKVSGAEATADAAEKLRFLLSELRLAGTGVRAQAPLATCSAAKETHGGSTDQ